MARNSIAARNISHHGDRKGRNGSRKTGPVKRTKFSHKAIPLSCDGDPKLRLRYPCGCVLSVEKHEVFLTLPEPPVSGKQKRFIGRLLDNTLYIFRNGLEFIRSRQAYGLDQHVLRAHQQIGFDKIHVETPARGGNLSATIDQLLARKPFRYRTYENQVAFKLNEIKAVS